MACRRTVAAMAADSFPSSRSCCFQCVAADLLALAVAAGTSSAESAVVRPVGAASTAAAVELDEVADGSQPFSFQ